MKKNILIELLEKIKRNKNNLENLKDVDNILSLDEKVLNSLARLDDDLFENGIMIAFSNNYGNMEDKIYAIELLKKLEKKEYVDYAANLLMAKNIIDAKLSETTINLLNDAPNEFNAKYISEVLTNEKILNNGLALKGATEIQKSSLEYKALIIYKFLLNLENSDIKIALEGMKILNQSLKKDNCYYASLALTEPSLIESGIALEGAKLINESPEYFNAEYVYKLLSNKNIEKATLLLESAKMINESLNDFQAKYTYAFLYEFLRSNKIIKFEIVQEGVKLIQNSPSECHARCVFKLLRDPVNPTDSALPLESAKIINETPLINVTSVYNVLNRIHFIDAKISIPLAKIMQESPNQYNSENIEYLSYRYEDNGMKPEYLFEGAKIINETTQSAQISHYVYSLLNYDYIKDPTLSMESAKIMKESTTEFNAECVFEFLTDKKLIDLGISLKSAKMMNRLKYITHNDNPNRTWNYDYQKKVDYIIKFIKVIIINNLDIPLEKIEILLNSISKEFYLQLSSLYSLELIKFITEQLHKDIEIDSILKNMNENFELTYPEVYYVEKKLDNMINYLDTIKDDDIDINTIINNNIIQPKSKVRKI